jgi:selenocysteine lyase/cysteine desulfurase
MVSLPIDHILEGSEARADLELHLRERHHIEVPILHWWATAERERFAVRLSCQVYNDSTDIDCLANALREFFTDSRH